MRHQAGDGAARPPAGTGRLRQHAGGDQFRSRYRLCPTEIRQRPRASGWRVVGARCQGDGASRRQSTWSRGPVRVSYAPTAITDIPATVLDAVGIKHALPGEPALVLDENAQRQRAFAMYNWEHENWQQRVLESLDVMEIDGRLIDGNSWKPAGSLYSPDAPPEARMRGLYALQRSRNGVQYRWSRPQAFFHAPPDARAFEIKVRSIAPKPQTVTLRYADQELAKLTLADQSWVTLKHALPLWAIQTCGGCTLRWTRPGSRGATGARSACRPAISVGPPDLAILHA